MRDTGMTQLQHSGRATTLEAEVAENLGEGAVDDREAHAPPQKGHYPAYAFEDLVVGMEASYARKVTAEDIVLFADVTGDRNPVHLDAAYAAGTIFKAPIAHGMLTAGYISTVFGMDLPGPGAIYVSQTLNFRGRCGWGGRQCVATG